jgi:large subunit ribosomal protein L29
MKAMIKISELRTKSPVELQQELNDLLKAKFNLRMQAATQQMTNNSQVKKVRRDIARVRTLLSEKARKS